MDSSPIARTARILRATVIVSMLLIALLYVAGRLGLSLGVVRVESALIETGGAAPYLVDLSILLFVLALWQLAKMLSAIAVGPLFAPPVTRSFRGFALLLFLSTLVDVFSAPALQLLRAGAGGDRHAIALRFELRDLLLLAGALFLFLLARMLEQARAYEAELEDIV